MVGSGGSADGNALPKSTDAEVQVCLKHPDCSGYKVQLSSRISCQCAQGVVFYVARARNMFTLGFMCLPLPFQQVIKAQCVGGGG